MSNAKWFRSLSLIVLGAVLGGLIATSWERSRHRATKQSPGHSRHTGSGRDASERHQAAGFSSHGGGRHVRR